MTELEREINNIIMQEVGLEVSKNDQIYDQDTGDALVLGGLDIMAPECYAGHNTAEFNPYNNRKQMGQLFDYFLCKHAEETGEIPVGYYAIGKGNDTRTECKTDKGVITSKPYKKETLRFTDLIMKMNCGESDDLSKYDYTDSSSIRKRR